jgi:uncharacterized membrane protein
MKGKILVHKDQKGIVLGEDGNRYNFSSTTDWHTDTTEPKAGQEVDFICSGADTAIEVYLLHMENSSNSKIKFNKENMPRVVYGLYALSLFIGLTAIAGVILAYIQRGEANEFEKTHYKWQIQTFWHALIGFIFSFFLFFTGIGILIFWLVYIWFIYRIVWGWVKYEKQQSF